MRRGCQVGRVHESGGRGFELDRFQLGQGSLVSRSERVREKEREHRVDEGAGVFLIPQRD